MQIKELTSLRGIFIFMIFLFHLHVYTGGGTLGVAFFFVLSGFSLTFGYTDRICSGEFLYKPFIAKRLIKFVPLHWLCLAAAVVLSAISVYVQGFDWTLIPKFFTNALLVQTWIPVESWYLSFNSVSWYLANTMFYAALFPLIVKYVKMTRRSVQYVVAASVAVIYALLLIFLPHSLYSPILYINPLVRLIDFGIGVYLAIGFKHLLSNEKIGHYVGKRYMMLSAVCLMHIVALVAISLLLPEDYRKYTVCYWMLIIPVVLMASFIGVYGGAMASQSGACVVRKKKFRLLYGASVSDALPLFCV